MTGNNMFENSRVERERQREREREREKTLSTYIYIYMIERPLGSICRLGFCSQYICIYNLNNLNN